LKNFCSRNDHRSHPGVIFYGPQGGVQLGFKMGDFHLDVIGMATSLQGDQETTSTYGGSTSQTIDAYTTTSMGADLMYVPWGLTLSSIMQEAEQDDQNGFKQPCISSPGAISSNPFGIDENLHYFLEAGAFIRPFFIWAKKQI
jgi:hypothetical protein